MQILIPLYPDAYLWEQVVVHPTLLRPFNMDESKPGRLLGHQGPLD